MNQLLQQFLDIGRGLWRFRWIAMVVAWTICLVGWVGELFLPDTYEASAQVFVDTRTTLSEVTQGLALESNVETQLYRVRQALLGGPQLEKVAQEAGFAAARGTAQQRQLLLAKLRDRIQITGSLAKDDMQSGLYVISYGDGDRGRSLRVVKQLVNKFVASTLGGGREGSEKAQNFLKDQIAEYERRLSTAESKLADFKRQNVGLMPGEQGDYFTRLHAEMEASAKAQTSLAVALTRRYELQRQLRGEQPVMNAAPNPQVGAMSTSQGNDTAAGIRQAQAHLDDLLLRFTDKHPDVIALRQTLAELHTRQDVEISALRRGDPGAAARLGLSANPVYQSIQLQLNQSDVEIAALRAELADHERRTDELRKLLNSAPEVEAELARLNRDYTVTHAQYDGLLDRLQRAKLSGEADQTGIVRFEVIEPPTAGFTPAAPNRPLLALMVLLVGTGTGAGVAYLLHQLRPVFSTTRQLHELTSLPVLGAVSMTWLERHQSIVRSSMYLYVGAGALLLTLSAAVVTTEGSLSRLAQSLLR